MNEHALIERPSSAAPVMETFNLYHHLLMEQRTSMKSGKRYLVSPQVYTSSELVPEAALDKLYHELDAALSPAGPEVGGKYARLLMGCYPAREMSDPKVFVRAIASVFAEAPDDVGLKVVDHLTRTLKFLPTRAEVCDAINERTSERHVALTTVMRMETEHKERRQREKDEAKRKGEREAWRKVHGEAFDAYIEISNDRRSRKFGGFHHFEPQYDAAKAEGRLEEFMDECDGRIKPMSDEEFEELKDKRVAEFTSQAEDAGGAV